MQMNLVVAGILTSFRLIVIPFCAPAHLRMSRCVLGSAMEGLSLTCFIAFQVKHAARQRVEWFLTAGQHPPQLLIAPHCGRLPCIQLPIAGPPPACALWCTPCDLLLTAPNTSCSRHLRRGRRGPGASGGGGWERRLGGNGLRRGGGGVGEGEPYSGGRAARDEFGVLREDCLEGAISLPFLGLSLLLVATSLPRCLLL